MLRCYRYLYNMYIQLALEKIWKCNVITKIFTFTSKSALVLRNFLRATLKLVETWFKVDLHKGTLASADVWEQKGCTQSGLGKLEAISVRACDIAVVIFKGWLHGCTIYYTLPLTFNQQYPWCYNTRSCPTNIDIFQHIKIISFKSRKT